MDIKQAFTGESNCILNTATLDQVTQSFLEHDVTDLFIVDEEDRLVGMVSEGDLIRYCMADYRSLQQQGLDAEETFEVLAKKGESIAGQSVMKIAITNPVFVTVDTPVHKAAGFMLSKNIRKLPVLEGDKLVGTVSRARIASLLLSGPKSE